jgi:hypothetical protein
VPDEEEIKQALKNVGNKFKGGSSKLAEKIEKMAEEIEDFVEEELKEFFMDIPEMQ